MYCKLLKVRLLGILLVTIVMLKKYNFLIFVMQNTIIKIIVCFLGIIIPIKIDTRMNLVLYLKAENKFAFLTT